MRLEGEWGKGGGVRSEKIFIHVSFMEATCYANSAPTIDSEAVIKLMLGNDRILKCD